MDTMYPAKVNSPATALDGDIDDSQTTISLVDASVLPDAPNLAVIGTGEDAETILYAGKSGNDLTSVTRGFQGVAKAWDDGTFVARMFTAYDLDALRMNVGGKVVRTATYVVAASNAPAHVKAQADKTCDGIDDHLDIQEMIDALPTGGGEISLSQGTFNIESSLVLDSHQTLRGCGRNTILTTTTANTEIITATGGSGTEKVGIIISDLQIDGGTGSISDCGICFTYVDKSTIYSIYSRRHNYSGDASGITLVDSDSNTLYSNTCEDSRFGIYLQASNRNDIFLNTCQGNTYTGIMVEGSGNALTANICQANGYGICLMDGELNNVESNSCLGNTDVGVYLTCGSDKNIITSNICQGNGLEGICIQSGDHITVTDNNCTENSQTTTNTSSDICMTGCAHCNIQSNTCRAGDLANKPKYGIDIEDAACIGNKVINNDLYDDGFGTAPYHNAGTGTIYVEPSDTVDAIAKKHTQLCEAADFTKLDGIRAFTKGWTAERLLKGAGVDVNPSEMRLKDFLYALTSYYLLYEPWKNLDGWTESHTDSGSKTLAVIDLRLLTGATSGSRASIYSGVVFEPPYTAGTDIIFQSVQSTVSLTNSVVKIYSCKGGSGVPPLDTNEHVGFKIVNGQIWVTNADGTTETATDTGVSIATAWTTAQLRIIGYTTSVEYYVNGILRATHTTNLPSAGGYFLYLGIHSTNAVAQTIRFRPIIIHR